ncbi:hypothetical protein [Tenacibaculum finnmarkense]|uniref:hypothetical protein n=1 Tax=Tenacibaculum finnmarkense TaxID=2781243 RepID=UPI001EFC0D09|nr:hypothetical protein [Tenacibaculum finnmarkense]MDB0610295.1 hypothetical protein [Tenacibaculum maritimum]
MKIEVNHKTKDFESYRALRVKSLFNVDKADTWKHTAEIPIDNDDWQIGLIIGASGTGKTSLGKSFFKENKIYNPYADWDNSKPIIDCIAPDGSFEEVTAALASVGLGDVPSWLKPFNVLSNGQQFRAGMARLIIDAPDEVVVDEFTSVVDRQIAKIGALAFAKGWRRNKGKKIVLLSPHYDIIEWLQPDWVYNTTTQELKKKIYFRTTKNQT